MGGRKRKRDGEGDGREKDRKRQERERNIGRETGVGERERDRDRENITKINGILSCRAERNVILDHRGQEQFWAKLALRASDRQAWNKTVVNGER